MRREGKAAFAYRLFLWLYQIALLIFAFLFYKKLISMGYETVNELLRESNLLFLGLYVSIGLIFVDLILLGMSKYTGGYRTAIGAFEFFLALLCLWEISKYSDPFLLTMDSWKRIAERVSNPTVVVVPYLAAFLVLICANALDILFWIFDGKKKGETKPGNAGNELDEKETNMEQNL